MKTYEVLRARRVHTFAFCLFTFAFPIAFPRGAASGLGWASAWA
jgi:hypothetical protein